MASVLGDAKYIALIDYLQKSHTVNSEYYAKQLRKAIKTETTGKLIKKNFLSPGQCSST